MVSLPLARRFGAFTRKVLEFVTPGRFRKQPTRSTFARCARKKILMFYGWETGETKSARENLKSFSSDLRPRCETVTSLSTVYAIPQKPGKNCLKLASNIVDIFA